MLCLITVRVTIDSFVWKSFVQGMGEEPCSYDALLAVLVWFAAIRGNSQKLAKPLLSLLLETAKRLEEEEKRGERRRFRILGTITFRCTASGANKGAN